MSKFPGQIDQFIAADSDGTIWAADTNAVQEALVAIQRHGQYSAKSATAIGSVIYTVSTTVTNPKQIADSDGKVVFTLSIEPLVAYTARLFTSGNGQPNQSQAATEAAGMALFPSAVGYSIKTGTPDYFRCETGIRKFSPPYYQNGNWVYGSVEVVAWKVADDNSLGTWNTSDRIQLAVEIVRP